jgi:hypothetical protein
MRFPLAPIPSTILKKLSAPLLCTMLVLSPLYGQKFLVGFGAGVSTLTLFSLGNQDYRTQYNLTETRGFPAPALMLHLGWLFGQHLSLGVDVGDLERGVQFGQISNGQQQVDLLRHTPFLGRLTWFVKPYGSIWNFSFRMGGGVLSQHVIRRTLTFTASRATNAIEASFPFIQTDAVLWPGFELLYRSNVNTLVVLSFQQPFLFQAPLLSYPVFYLGIQVEISSLRPKTPPSPRGDAVKPARTQTNSTKGK